MNTKGIKFLAVLAVLAMAFAAFAVMTDTEQNSAAIPEEVTTVSTEADFRTAITGDKEFNVKLGANIVIDANSSTTAKTAYLVKSAGVIDFNGYTITAKVVLEAVTLTKSTISWDTGTNDYGLKSIIVNESSGLTLKDTSADGNGGIINACKANNHNAVLYNSPDGVMTVDSGSYKVDNAKIEYGAVTTTDSYWYTVKNLGTMTINGGYIGGMNHLWASQQPGSDATVSALIDNGWYVDTPLSDVSAVLTINGGTFEYGGYIKLDKGSEATINGGTVKNGLNGAFCNYGEATINAVTLEGKKTSVFNIAKAGNKYAEGVLDINCDLAIVGTLYNVDGTVALNDSTVTLDGLVRPIASIDTGAKAGSFVMNGSSGFTFEQGTVIPANAVFKYTDKYGDVHSFKNTAEMTVGISGLRIFTAENSVMVSGTTILGEATAFETTGNVSISGTVYTEGKKLTLGGEKSNADLKISSFQVTTTTGAAGAVELKYSALVASGSFIVAGNLIVDPGMILKVAEGSTVKTEGKLVASAASGDKAAAQVWNAGVVNATGYALTEGATTDDIGASQLFSIYMNGAKGAGTFYKGTEVFDPIITPTMGESATRVISDAYGAYIEMTGRSTVNLASGAISVTNALFKYNTLIIATFSDTIALSVVTDNQYDVDIKLDGKTATNTERGAKFATFSGVNWSSANSAVIKITAPEVFKVQLIRDNSVATNIVYWANGEIGFVDSTNKNVLIKTSGVVELIFGEHYTVTGLEDKNYVFSSTNKAFAAALDVKGRTQAQFDMIRNIEDGVIVTDLIPFVITEGDPIEITVTLSPADGAATIADGETVLLYKVGENGKTMTVAKSDKMKITGIYTNEVIYLKAPVMDFNKIQNQAITDWLGKKVDGTASGLEACKLSESDAANAWAEVGTTGKFTGEAKPTIKLDATPERAEYTFTVTPDSGNKTTFNNTFTITWQKSALASKTKVTAPTTNKEYLYADEIILIDWEEKDGARQVLKVNGVVYEKNTPLTITSEMVAAGAAKTIDLAITEIFYVDVKNSTETAFVISDKTVAKDGKAVAANTEVKKAVEQIDNIVKISIEGSYVISWSYKLTVVNEEGSTTTTGYATGTVGGASGAFNFLSCTGEVPAANNVAATPVTGKVTAMEITTINSEKIVYIVKTQPKDHMDFDGRTSTAGYFGDTMYIYANVDPLFKLEKVYVYKELKDGVPSTEYFEATKENGYFKYTMPSHNVVLVPDVSANYAKVTFTNWDGEVLQSTDEKKGTMPEYKGATPVKPSVGTESYKFVGWDPAIAEVTQDVTYVAQFVPVEPSSENVTVAIGQTGADVNFIVFSNDQKAVGAGKISYVISYTYVNELGRQAVGHIDGEVEYDAAEPQTFVKLTVTGLADALKDNYNGAFAVTGTYTFGDAAGSLSKTVYNPVLEA